jgi:SAM-dependent methyltransferase
MKLKDIVPWGRTLKEYQLMFNLSDADLNLKILGCGDGPASFNAEMTEFGYKVVSLDPIYQFSAEEIRKRVEASYQPIISLVTQNRDRYVWQTFHDPEELGKARLAAMEKFLLDYEIGKAEGRYLAHSLPNLDFSSNQFELCVCSHLLFLYSDNFSLDFHLASIQELLRIAPEVRIFPLFKMDCTPSPYVDVVIQEFSSQGYQVQIETVAYEFQKGGNQMLSIKKVASEKLLI